MDRKMTNAKPTPSSFAPHGVDVSEFQRPALVPVWAEFEIVRATFGTRKDKRTREHARFARDTGRTLGLYAFFIPTVQVSDQLDAFGEQAAAVGFGAGDIVPWIDVEPTALSGGTAPCVAWAEPLRQMLDGLAEAWGGAGSYCDDQWWAALGKPSWLLERPLWSPEYRTAPGLPSTAGGVRPALWQYRVGPQARGALHRMGDDRKPGAIDHDCALGPLPLLGVEPEEQTEPSAQSVFVPSLSLGDDYWAEHRAVRDRMIHGSG